MLQLSISVLSISSPNRRRTSCCAGVEAAVEEGGADQRLERVGQDRRALRAAAAGFALGQAQHLRQAERQRGAVQAVLAHQVGAHARQVAFVRAGEALVQQRRDGQVQHRVAEELEPLVVVGAEAAVRQRARQQRGLRKAMAQALLQGVERGLRCMFAAYLERPSYLISRYTGSTIGISLS